MGIRSLITESLAVEKEENLSPEEIISKRERIVPEEMIKIVQEARELVKSSPKDLWPVVARMAAYQTTSRIFSSREFNSLILIKAHSATLGDKEALAWIDIRLESLEGDAKDAARKLRRESAIGSFSQSIDFLRELFEDDTVDFLVDATGVKKATARRWVAGGAAEKKNAFTVYSIASGLFALYHDRGWGKEKTREWLYSPLPSGRENRKAWSGFHLRMDPGLRVELRKIGLL